MPIPEKLRQWAEQPGVGLHQPEMDFVELVRTCAAWGVAYGFMQRVVEWMWQEHVERTGFPGAAWGPEYYTARIAELEGRVAELESLQPQGEN